MGCWSVVNSRIIDGFVAGSCWLFYDVSQPAECQVVTVVQEQSGKHNGRATYKKTDEATDHLSTAGAVGEIHVN